MRSVTGEEMDLPPTWQTVPFLEPTERFRKELTLKIVHTHAHPQTHTHTCTHFDKRGGNISNLGNDREPTFLQNNKVWDSAAYTIIYRERLPTDKRQGGRLWTQVLQLPVRTSGQGPLIITEDNYCSMLPHERILWHAVVICAQSVLSLVRPLSGASSLVTQWHILVYNCLWLHS